MVLLQTLVPEGKVLVMKEIMCHIVHYVAEDSTTVDSRRKMPVEEEERVRQLPKGRCKGQEEGGWHD